MTRLNQEAVRLLHSADTKEKLLAAGTEAVDTSSEEFVATIKIAMAAKVVKAANIRLE